MKSKTEKKLDEEFERIGVKPNVYHFRDIYLEDTFRFTAITVAAMANCKKNNIINDINACGRPDFYLHNHASHLLRGLTARSYGVAICDKRDQFNRQRGRIIAKGRLLKHLKKEAK